MYSEKTVREILSWAIFRFYKKEPDEVCAQLDIEATIEWMKFKKMIKASKEDKNV